MSRHGVPATSPWIVDLDPFFFSASTNWGTPTAANTFYGGYSQSSGAQNDEIDWDVVVGAGTWKFALIHYTGTFAGIYSVQIDGTTVGTIDGYVNPGGPNAIAAPIVGIVVATTGKKRVGLKMATKNASSSGYYGLIHHAKFLRTA